MPRYVLCRPLGGLNDILCQIERCCRYAVRFDRIVVVETDFPRTIYFADAFDRYFESRDPALILSAEGIVPGTRLIYPASERVGARLRTADGVELSCGMARYMGVDGLKAEFAWNALYDMQLRALDASIGTLLNAWHDRASALSRRTTRFWR